jgi:glycosyltransferase involved in cell wall biosynthesis
MNILIVTQHFPPEKGAVRRLFEFARFFVRNGEKVSVMTAIPNYPDGVVPKEYRGKFFHVEEVDGVKIYRSYVLPAANRYPGKRMVGFVVFLVTSLINFFRVKDDFDIILASTPPVTSPVIGWIMSKIKRAKFIIEIRDLQPESSEEFGNLKQSIFTRSLKKFMHTLYRRADHIVSVTDGITDYLIDIGIQPQTITTIKSGVSSEFFYANSNGIRRKFGWEDKFLVLHAGTLGWAHAHETVVEAARLLIDQPDILFVFVGDGQKKSVLEGMVRDYGLKNIKFVGLQPLEAIPHFLKASDVLIASLKDVPVAKRAFPSKLFEYMATGRPIVFGASEGEVIQELEKAGGALWFPADDPEKLAELILKLKTGEIDGKKLGEKYHHHIIQHHRRELWASKYLSLIRNL